jgi:hypothetical protein
MTDLRERGSRALLRCMPSAACALCGARQPLRRVYVGMQHPRPNLLAISCTSCKTVSSQLQSLDDYLRFAVIYGCSTLLLLALGVAALEDVHIAWLSLVAAALPAAVLPGWWCARIAHRFQTDAPSNDLTLRQKLLYLFSATSVIAVIVGVGLFAFLLLLA